MFSKIAKVKPVLAPRVIIVHELCAYLLAKTVPASSNMQMAREEIGLQSRSKVILRHPSRMFYRILTRFLQRFLFSFHVCVSG